MVKHLRKVARAHGVDPRAVRRLYTRKKSSPVTPPKRAYLPSRRQRILGRHLELQGKTMAEIKDAVGGEARAHRAESRALRAAWRRRKMEVLVMRRIAGRASK
jgi:hypothetical protein